MSLTPLELARLVQEAEELRREFWRENGTGPDVNARKLALRARHREIQEILRLAESTPPPPAVEPSEPLEVPAEDPVHAPPSREPSEIEPPIRQWQRLRKVVVGIGLIGVVAVLVFPFLPYLMKRDAESGGGIEGEVAGGVPNSLLNRSVSPVPAKDAGDVTVAPKTDHPIQSVSWNTRNPDIGTNGNVELAMNLLEQDPPASLHANGPPPLSVHEFAQDPRKYFGQLVCVEGTVNYVSGHKKEVLTSEGQKLSFLELHLDTTESPAPLVFYVPSESDAPVKGNRVVAEGLPVGYLELNNSSGGTATYPALVGSLRQVLGNAGQSAVNHLGDVVVLASLELVATDVREVQHLDAVFANHEPKYAQSGKKFVVISLTVLNRTESDFLFSPDFGGVPGSGCQLRLRDDQGTEYLTYDDSIWFLQGYLNYRNLRPKVPESGSLAYEVPSDGREYKLMLDESIAVVLAKP